MQDNKFQDEGTSIIALVLSQVVKVYENEYRYREISIIAVVLVNWNAGQLYQDEGTSIIPLASRKLVKVYENEYQYRGTSIIIIGLVSQNIGH